MVICQLNYWNIGEVQKNQLPSLLSCIEDQMKPFCDEKNKQDRSEKSPDHSKTEMAIPAIFRLSSRIPNFL